MKKLCAVNVVDQYLTKIPDKCPFSLVLDGFFQWSSEYELPKELKSYCEYVVRNWNFIAYPEEAWAWGENESIEEDEEEKVIRRKKKNNLQISHTDRVNPKYDP